MQEENERLQAKIDGLKQEYEKIGLQVFHAFKESFFTNLEDFLAKRRLVSIQTGLMNLPLDANFVHESLLDFQILLRSEEGGGIFGGGGGAANGNGDSAAANGNSTEQLFTFK